jgi:hypothetical protein
MAIKINCPNGHPLRVKQEFAGRQAVCPRCQARVTVPAPAAPGLSDTSVVALLGEVGADRAVVAKVVPSAPRRSMRTCPKCCTQISAAYHICPRCRVYLPAMAQSVPVTVACPTCGSEGPAGQVFCPTCGADFRAA